MPPAAPQKKIQNPQSQTSNVQQSLDGASSVFADDLAQHEKLLWQSRAGAGAYAIAHLRAVVMGLTLVVAAIGWHAFVTRHEMMVELKLVAWIFVAVGVLYGLAPVWAFGKAKWFFFYALTNQRLLILQVFPKRKMMSFPIKTVKRVVAIHAHTGNGTLLIDAPGAATINPIRPRAGFYGVKYVSKVVEAVEILQNPEAALKRAQAQQAQQSQPARPARPTLQAQQAPLVQSVQAEKTVRSFMPSSSV